MKITTNLFLVAIAILISAGCNNSASEGGGSEHDMLVQTEKELNTKYKRLTDRLSDLREQNDEFEEMFGKQESPDSAAVATIENYRNLLLTHYGTLQKQEQIFKTHKEYIHKHEKTAISPGEIMAQHGRMKTDHEQMGKELSNIEYDLNRIEKAMKTMQTEMN